MKGRILTVGAACVAAFVLAALAQSDVNPAGDPAASDESQAASARVVTGRLTVPI